MSRSDDAPRLPMDPRATTASRRGHVFGWPLAVGVAVVLTGLSAVAWRMRAAPEMRPVQQPASTPPTSRASAPPGVAVDANPDTGTAAVVDAPTMQPVANATPGLPRARIASASVAVALQGTDLPEPATPLPAEVRRPVEAVSLPDSAPAASADTAEAMPALGEDDQPLDAQPPATADSMPVQQAWLQRIAELDAAGDVDGARQSLAVFRQRFPGVTIPEGLRALEP